jgi:hypothetical protein
MRGFQRRLVGLLLRGHGCALRYQESVSTTLNGRLDGLVTARHLGCLPMTRRSNDFHASASPSAVVDLSKD